MKNIYLSLIMIIIISVIFSGCASLQGVQEDFSIPEAENIQLLLDELSGAILENDIDTIKGSFSEDCPRGKASLDNLQQLMDNTSLKSYSQNIITAKRLKDGVAGTVSISYEGDSGNKSINRQYLRDMYFILEGAAWTIGDYNYYPYMNPTVVVGSESLLYDAAYLMSEELGSNLRTDTEHLQSYGDILLVGTPYDNASILDLEEKGRTIVKVNDEYPGNDIGIVQVLSNIESYRHAVVIQSSDTAAAADAIRFMTQYLKNNPYMNPGVYFIEEGTIRKATTLELTTLATLNMEKASQRLKEVQRHMESNISVMKEELEFERDQLLREQFYSDNRYRNDYSKAFSRYDLYPEKSIYDSIMMINANFMDSRLCTSAFRLPHGNNGGTAYAYADYSALNNVLSDEKANADSGLILSGNASHTLISPEINGSGNSLELTVIGTSLLRLSGFSASEVYNATGDEGNAVFINTDAGYAVAPGSPIVHTPMLQLDIGRLQYIYNDGAFINLESNAANFEAEEADKIFDRAGELFRLSGRYPKGAPAKAPVKKSELEDTLYIPYSTEDIYSLLRNTFAADYASGSFSTLDEAREGLRSAMGELLALKCTRFIVNSASRFPGSQFDYARYAAGLINVEHPNAYAEASEASRLLKNLGGGISNRLSDSSAKTQKIIEVLKGISDEAVTSDRFFFPDYSIANNRGSHRDKALLAYGLYSRLSGSSENAYIALGEEGSYLIFKEDSQWKYIDCRYNTVRNFVNDDIYAVFNKDYVYNKKLDKGDLPSFLK